MHEKTKKGLASWFFLYGFWPSPCPLRISDDSPALQFFFFYSADDLYIGSVNPHRPTDLLPLSEADIDCASSCPTCSVTRNPSAIRSGPRPQIEESGLVLIWTHGGVTPPTRGQTVWVTIFVCIFFERESSSICSGTDEPWGREESAGLLGSMWPHALKRRSNLLQNQYRQWFCVPVKIFFFFNSSSAILLIISHLSRARNTQFCTTASPFQW